jgi:Ca-activated chloride channel family protein
MRGRRAFFLSLGIPGVFALAAALGGCGGLEPQSAPESASRESRPNQQAGPGGREELWIIGRPVTGEVPSRSSLLDEESPPPGGELRARLPGGRRTVPLPLKHTDVKGRISIYMASVRVRQEYHNPYSQKIEAVYVFPLPEESAVREFVMTIGDRHIRGIIREREEARKIYREARRQGYVASLLTEERPNIFTQSVANIEPGREIDIDITYFHTLRYRDGEYEFVFPMVVGPRFNPPGFTGGIGAVPAGTRPGRSSRKRSAQYLRPAEISSHDISLELELDAGLPLEDIRCLTHRVDIERRGESRARVSLGEGDRIPNRDFVLRYRPAGRGIRPALATLRDDTGAYFTLVLHPPERLSEVPAMPREMVFVLDCSESMSGHPLDRARSFVKRCLERMRPCDTFQVIRFSESASPMGKIPVPATPGNVKRALEYVESLRGGGETLMVEGVKAALDFPHESERYRFVVFLTDGYIGNEREILREVRSRLGASRIFSFGVGTPVNRYLLEEMARVGRGAVAYAGLQDQDPERVDRFFERIEHPALTDLEVDRGGLGATDVFPHPIPDLFVGRPVVLTGRLISPGAKGTIQVRGRIGGRLREIPISLDLENPATVHEALGSIWARAKMASLQRELVHSLHGEEIEEQIKQLALRHGLLSGYTAFVAVDSLTRTEGGNGTAVPVPAGVRYETTVGE